MSVAPAIPIFSSKSTFQHLYDSKHSSSRSAIKSSQKLSKQILKIFRHLGATRKILLQKDYRLEPSKGNYAVRLPVLTWSRAKATRCLDPHRSLLSLQIGFQVPLQIETQFLTTLQQEITSFARPHPEKVLSSRSCRRKSLQEEYTTRPRKNSNFSRPQERKLRKNH